MSRFRDFGWVVLFLVVAALFYVQGMQKKEVEHLRLKEKISVLEAERDKVVAEKDELELEIKSEDDPKWVELMLKKNLGLVPEGETKVYFK